MRPTLTQVSSGLSPRAQADLSAGRQISWYTKFLRDPASTTALRRAFFQIESLQFVDERRPAQMQQARGLALVAAGFLEAAQNQFAFELRDHGCEIDALVRDGHSRHQHRRGALA